MRCSFCLLLLLSACNGPAIPNGTAEAAAPAVAPAKLLLDVRAAQPFSDKQRSDKFRLQLLGTSASMATAHFSIVTAAGDTVWSERFPAAQLLAGYGPEPTTAAAREARIRERANAFFAPKNFPAAAIDPKAAFDAHYADNPQAWREVQQRRAPGFQYTLGEEDGRTLGYSAKLGKAVVVQRCC